MDHLAILKKQWGLLNMIKSGRKIAESRWYKNRVTPWNKIKVGDTLFFKDSGHSVTLKAYVTRIIQYQVEDNNHAINILRHHAKDDLGFEQIPPEIKNYIKNKKYAIFIWFNNVVDIKPFEIDKTGFGSQSAWITVDDINKIKI